MQSLGQRIREERRKHNLTLDQPSQLIKFPKSFLTQIEGQVAQPCIGKDR
jgi:cytoskeletal protein RodZ